MATAGTLQGFKTRVFEATKGKIRSQPVSPKLRKVLDAAARAAGVTVTVTSGGQAKKGTKGARTGSVRHDLGNAADLQLKKDGRVLDFTNSADRAVFEKFVATAAANGATGIGAGIGYMGPHTIHVGFGGEAVWGAGGKAANAPGWLANAVNAGWQNPNAFAASDVPVPSAEVSPIGSRNLKYRKINKMDGPDVAALQQTLAAAGYDAGPIDGVYGRKTEEAVKAYQADLNKVREVAGVPSLEVDGIVGPETRTQLVDTMRRQALPPEPGRLSDEYAPPTDRFDPTITNPSTLSPLSSAISPVASADLAPQQAVEPPGRPSPAPAAPATRPLGNFVEESPRAVFGRLIADIDRRAPANAALQPSYMGAGRTSPEYARPDTGGGVLAAAPSYSPDFNATVGSPDAPVQSADALRTGPLASARSYTPDFDRTVGPASAPVKTLDQRRTDIQNAIGNEMAGAYAPLGAAAASATPSGPLSALPSSTVGYAPGMAPPSPAMGARAASELQGYVPSPQAAPPPAPTYEPVDPVTQNPAVAAEPDLVSTEAGLYKPPGPLTKAIQSPIGQGLIGAAMGGPLGAMMGAAKGAGMFGALGNILRGRGGGIPNTGNIVTQRSIPGGAFGTTQSVVSDGRGGTVTVNTSNKTGISSLASGGSRRGHLKKITRASRATGGSVV